MIIENISYLESLRKGIEELLTEDPLVYLIGEDVSEPYGGAFKVTKGLSLKFPGRIVNMPMSEQGFTGLGVGLALGGLHPVVEIMFGDFVTLIADQIINHASKFTAGFNKEIHLVIRTPMGGYRGYGATHSQSLEKLFFGLPDIHVVAPSVLHDPGFLLKQSMKVGCPVLFVENKLDYTRRMFLSEKKSELLEIKSTGNEFPVIEAGIKGEEQALTVISYGGMISPLLSLIHEIYMEQEFPVKLIAPSRISPLDYDLLSELTINDKLIITVEEGHIPCGFGDSVISNLVQLGSRALFKAFGAKNKIIAASKKLEDEVLPDFGDIKSTIINMIH